MVIGYETADDVLLAAINAPMLSAADRARATTLTDLVHRTFARAGHRTGGDARILTREELVWAALGPNATAESAAPLPAALERLGLDREGYNYVWRPRVTRSTKALDRSLLAAYRSSDAGRAARARVR